MKVAGTREKRGESTVSGENTNKGESHATFSLDTYRKAV